MKNIPWGPIRSCLTDNFSFGDIKSIVGYADLDMSQLSHLEQRQPGGSTKSQLLSAIDNQISKIDENKKGLISSICCEEMLRKKPQLLDELERVFSRVGWKFSGSTLLPIDVFDISDLMEIPEKAHADIMKAASRLRDGDLSGALSSACGALDSVTNSIYGEFNLGDPNKDSFQNRIKHSLDAVSAKSNLQAELQDIGWNQQGYKPLIANLESSLNQAAFIMQKLRSDMGDVHGTKPVLKSLVFDSIKWALILLRILGSK